MRLAPRFANFIEASGHGAAPKGRAYDRIVPGVKSTEKPLHRRAESFIGRLRDKLLNETLFRSLPHTHAALEAWRADYNTGPHSRLGWMTSAVYDAERRSAALHCTDGSAPGTAVITAQDGNVERQTPIAAG
jgi:transposase InsO family protein